MVAEMVLAELTGAVAQIVEERGESGRPGPQVGRAARELRRDHARTQRIHAREEGIAPGRATLLSVVGHHDRTFFRNPVNVGRFPDHQAAMIATRLHPTDIIAHDEDDVWFVAVCRLRCRCDERNKHSDGPLSKYVWFWFHYFLFFSPSTHGLPPSILPVRR